MEDVFRVAIHLHDLFLFADLELLVAQHTLLDGVLFRPAAGSVGVSANIEFLVEQKSTQLESFLVKSHKCFNNWCQMLNEDNKNCYANGIGDVNDGHEYIVSTATS